MKMYLCVVIISLTLLGAASACGSLESMGLSLLEKGTPTPRPAFNLVCEEIDDVKICGSVSEPRPAQNSTVTVFGEYYVEGEGVANLTMETTWRYKTTTTGCNGITDAAGLAQCSRAIGKASPDYQVDVDVEIRGHKVTTWFTPK